MVQRVVILLAASLALGAFGYACQNRTDHNSSNPVAAATPAPLIIPISDGFDYPVGETPYVTQAKDRAGWRDPSNYIDARRSL